MLPFPLPVTTKRSPKLRKLIIKGLGLGFVSSVISHDPDEVITNYSSYQLSNIEENVLPKDLRFALSPICRLFNPI